MKDFRDRVAAITGAGSGIGRALAVLLAGRGCHLALSDVDESGLAETAMLASVANASVRVTSERVDVADRALVFAWASSVVREHGKVNLIFNNAGVALGASAERVKIEDFQWLMNINFWGVVHGTKAFLPHLRKAGDGHVVNISSIFGLLTMPTQSAYHAAKFAVRGYTESLRQELDLLRCGVSASCVHPGGIKTNIARNSRRDESLRDFGIDPKAGTGNIEKSFITTPERAAEIILKGVERNSRRVLVGRDAVLLEKLQRFFPFAASDLMARRMARARSRS